MKKIRTADDLISAVEEYGMLFFWDENNVSAWTMSGVSFNDLWNLREEAVNSKRIAYGKYMRKKSTFVSLELFPRLCALRRDGYDYDSLVDEGLGVRRENEVMRAIEGASGEPVPSYALGKSLGMKGYDGVVTSLQNKTYLCVTFKKSSMGTALLNKPEDIFGFDFVRSMYSIAPEENIKALEAAKGLERFSRSEIDKILCKAI